MWRKLWERICAQVAQTLGALIDSGRDYVRIVLGGSEGAGLNTLRTLALGGPRYWIGLTVMICALLATAYLSLGSARLPMAAVEIWDGEIIAAPTPALWMALLIVAFGWAYLLAGAARAGLWAYTIAVAYVTYYGLTPGLALSGTWWFAAVTLWLLAWGAWIAARQTGVWRWGWLLLLSLLTGLLSFKATGSRAVWPWPGGQAALGALLFAIVANPWARRLWRHPWLARYGDTLGAAATLTLFLSLYGLSYLRTAPNEFLSLTFVSLHDLLGLLGLFWFWLGLDLFTSASDLAEWITLSAKRLVPARLARWIILALWLAGIAYAYLASHTPPLWLLSVLAATPPSWRLLQLYGNWRPAYIVGDTMQYYLVVLVAVTLVALGLLVARKLTYERLMGLFSFTLVALFVLWGGMELFYAFNEESGNATLGLGPLLLYLGGMFWQVLKNSDDLVAGGEVRVALFTGFLLCLAGISLIELAAHYRYFEMELSLNTFSGAMYLGLPYLLYTYLYARRRYTPVASGHLLILFAVGMVSALPVLLGAPLWIAPLLWLAALSITAWRWGRWDDPLDGPVYAIALALGLVIYRTRPPTLPIPLYLPWVSRFYELQSGFAQEVIWPWEGRWWVMIGGALLAGAALGYGCARARRGGQWPKRLGWLLLGLALASGLMLVVDSML